MNFLKKIRRFSQLIDDQNQSVRICFRICLYFGARDWMHKLRFQGRVIKKELTFHGYLTVALCHENVTLTFTIHIHYSHNFLQVKYLVIPVYSFRPPGTANSVMTIPNVPLPKTPDLFLSKSCLKVRCKSMRDDLLTTQRTDSRTHPSLDVNNAPACIR